MYSYCACFLLVLCNLRTSLATDREGFWGPPTASIDWCESNYVVSPMIAEFWNTVSNLLFVLLGTFGFITKLMYRYEMRYLVLDLYIAIIGVGSAAFHGTLLLSSQLLDEVPMVWGVAQWILILLNNNNINNNVQLQRTRNVCFVSCLIWTLLSPYVHRHHNTVFEMLIAVMMVGSLFMAYGFYQHCQKSGKWLYPTYVVVGLLGTFLWRVDQVACTTLKYHLSAYWWHAYMGSLHGYWHILMAIHVFLASAFGIFIRNEALGLKPEIKWFCKLM